MRAGSIALAATALLAAASAWTRLQRVQAARAWIIERTQLAPAPRAADRYVGSDACKACHPTAWQSWHDSHHRTMTQLASRQSIAARWDGVELPDGTQLRFDGERPVAVHDGGTRIDPIVLTTGAHHMQIFWTPSKTGETLHALPWAWLVDDARFVPNEATLLRPPGEPVDYTWNRVCIRCHTVAGSPGWRAGTGAIDSRVVELGIACESCHGPARAHALAHRTVLDRFTARTGDAPDPTIVNPARLAPAAASEICAQCHAFSLEHDEARWLAHGPAHAPPDALSSWGTLVRHPAHADVPELDAVLEADADYLVDRFWSDGMVRVTGREHGAMIESSCAKNGELSCLSCHSMHAGAPDDQLRADAEGDGACLSCHDAPSYAIAAHTHHAPEGEGARCTSCHMPHTSWGLLGAIRSHQIDRPDPEVSDVTGRPLACNLCHLDRSRDWSRAWWAHWWRGAAQPRSEREPLARAAAIAWLVAGDAGQRALAAWHMAWPPGLVASGGGWQAELLLQTLDDPYPAVRVVGWRALARLLGDDMPVLGDGELPGPEHVERIRAVMPRSSTSIDDGWLLELRKARNEQRVALAE